MIVLPSDVAYFSRTVSQTSGASVGCGLGHSVKVSESAVSGRCAATNGRPEWRRGQVAGQSERRLRSRSAPMPSRSGACIRTKIRLTALAPSPRVNELTSTMVANANGTLIAAG